MPKPKKGARLGSGPTHQGHLLRGLSASLIMEERIRTTEAKARLLRPFVEKLVTLGKDDTLHSRRQAIRVIEDSDIVHKLFAEISPRFSERNGGYTRILKLGPRQGDAAPMAIIEFVESEAEVVASDSAAAKKRGLRRRKKDEGSAAEEKAAPAKPAAKKAKTAKDDEPEAKPTAKAKAKPAQDDEPEVTPAAKPKAAKAKTEATPAGAAKDAADSPDE